MVEAAGGEDKMAVGLAPGILAYSGKGYKIDHVAHTPGVAVSEVDYLTQVGDRHLAGEKSNAPISDHAALRFELA